MKIKNLVLIFAICFVSLFSVKAYAEESGTCGEDLTWTLDDEGTLTISGEDGWMDNYNYDEEDYEEETPWALWCNEIKSLNIEEGVRSIGDYAFYSCSELNSISLPDSLWTIGNYAFYGCYSLKEISIPSEVFSIGDSVFKNCYDLTDIYMFDNDSLEYIGDSAFAGCESLTSIYIPESVENIGKYAFDDCSSLESIDVSYGNNTYFTDDEDYLLYGVLFSKNEDGEITLVRWPAGKSGPHTIPNNVVTIGDSAFYNNYDVTNIEIPSSVINIEPYAFSGTEITKIDLPIGLKSVQEYAFSDCDYLKDIYFGGTEAQWKAVDVDSTSFPSGATIHYTGVTPVIKPKTAQTITAYNKTLTINSNPVYLGARTSGNGRLTYGSTATSVATVSATGVITPRGYGVTTIIINAAETTSHKAARKTVTVTVVPKKMKLSKVKSTAKKTILIKWKKDGTATGYQVQLCRKKNFKTGTLARVFKSKVTKKTITNIKSKTWFVRIRSYKKVGSMNCYGPWSAVKKVKVK